MSQRDDVEPAEILELFGKRATVIKPGLDRISHALDLLGYPGRNTPCVVVGGTNGKGSTCGFLFRMLSAAGVRTGLFTSPHLVEFRERISISDHDVTNEVLVGHIESLKKTLPHSLWQDLSFFEINTLLAARVFDEFKTDVNILEVGLGGRLDSVNVFDSDVAVITSIGMDHQEFLGHTEVEIAREKSGIMRRGKPVIWGGPRTSGNEAHLAIVESARELGAQLIVPEQMEPSELPKMIKSYPSFLSWNFTIAHSAFRALAASGRCSKLNDESIARAIDHFDDKSLPWPVTLVGRFEQVTVSKSGESRELLIDVCHNPHGARALASALAETGLVAEGAKRPCLISILTDKDASGIWAEIRGKISDVIRFRIDSARSWSQEDMRIAGPMMDSFKSAWHAALARDDWRSQQPWLVFGSVAAVGSVLTFLRNDGWTVTRKLRD